MLVEAPLGDVVDRITILLLKHRHLVAPDARADVQRELDTLTAAWEAAHRPLAEVGGFDRLCEVNAALWDVEDRLRELEATGDFGETFVELARSVYVLNDERARLKRAINDALGSRLVERKSYASTAPVPTGPAPVDPPVEVPAAPAVPATAVQLVARRLRERGARRCWGMPGGDSLPLIDALAAEGIDLVLVRDEASAGFAADATAQLTGGPGVCVATLGPGITNLIPGIAGALLDRAPVVALTSRYRSDRIGTYTHMILNQRDLIRPVGKHHVQLSAANIEGELHRALTVMTAPRPGPVWVEIPGEVASAPIAPGVGRPDPEPLAAPLSEGLRDRIHAWERPVLLVGFAARNTGVGALAEALGAPVITTYKAKGAIPEGAGWSAGAAGLSPVADAHHQALVGRADGLILLGWDPVELRDHWLPGWGAEPEVVVVDTGAPTDLPTRIDALAVGAIGPWVAALAAAGPGRSRWRADEVAAHRDAWGASFVEDGLGPATAVRAIQAAVADDTVVTLDVGAHRITAANVWACARPDTLLQSNGLSSMGYGLPAALAVCAEGRPAVAILGDMGLQMTLGELGVAAERGWDLVVVVFADASLALIELKQGRRGGPLHMLRFANPRWSSLAAAFGGRGRLVHDAVALGAAARDAQRAGGLHIIAAAIDPSWYTRQM